MAGNFKKKKIKKSIYLFCLKKEKIRKEVPEERFAVPSANLGFWLPARLSCDLHTSLDTRTSESLQVLPSAAKNNHPEPGVLLKAKLA